MPNSIVAVANGVEGMKAYRDDVRAKAVEAGRNPDDIKVLFLIAPTLGDTHEEAWARHNRRINSDLYLKKSLALYGSFTEVDFSPYDLDKPLPEKLTTNGEQGSLDKFQQWGSGKTLRQLTIEGGNSSSLELVGTPDEVADQMGEAMAAVGGDGFLITAPTHRVSRRYVIEICEGLIPALQKRGLSRTAYTKSMLRDTLREF